MKKSYIQPQLTVVNLVTESVLISMSATSGKTTNDVWTNKKDGPYDSSFSSFPWGEDTEE